MSTGHVLLALFNTHTLYQSHQGITVVALSIMNIVTICVYHFLSAVGDSAAGLCDRCLGQVIPGLQQRLFESVDRGVLLNSPDNIDRGKNEMLFS